MLQDAAGAEIDCLVSAERVSINHEACVLCVLQDITARKRSERELITAIEAVMADASWFSHGVIDKLARPAPPAALWPAVARGREPDDPRAGHAYADLPGRDRPGDRRRAEAVTQHGAQPRFRLYRKLGSTAAARWWFGRRSAASGRTRGTGVRTTKP